MNFFWFCAYRVHILLVDTWICWFELWLDYLERMELWEYLVYDKNPLENYRYELTWVWDSFTWVCMSITWVLLPWLVLCSVSRPFFFFLFYVLVQKHPKKYEKVKKIKNKKIKNKKKRKMLYKSKGAKKIEKKWQGQKATKKLKFKY